VASSSGSPGLNDESPAVWDNSCSRRIVRGEGCMDPDHSDHKPTGAVAHERIPSSTRAPIRVAVIDFASDPTWNRSPGRTIWPLSRRR
jgi:hypothetical protein